MTRNAPTASRPRAWIWTLAITASVYASSPLHRLAGGDSGELLAEACIGGNAHPPGYPLLLLTLRIVRRVGGYACPQVPFVVVANNLNAAFAASAAACVTHVVELLVGHGHELEAIAAGLVCGFSDLTWEYARGLEVFALNSLVVGLLLVCFVRHASNRSKTNLYMGAFLCGLGLTNQHTIVLFAAPLILCVVSSTRLGLLDWIFLTTAFATGLSPYAYTYSVARTPTPGSWGDASTFRGFIAQVLRREYGTFQLSPIRGSSESLHTRLAFYATDITSEFSAVGTLCGIVGVLAALGGAVETPPCPSPNARVSRYLVVTMLAVYLLVFNSLANLPLDAPLPREVTRRFFLQPNILVAILMGLGLTSLRHWCERCIRPSLAYLAFTVVTFSLVIHQYLRNRDHLLSAPTAHHDLLRDFGQSILQDLPANAVLLSYTDVQWNSVRYLQACENTRPDVVHLNLQLMAYPWFQRQHTLYSSIKFPPVLPDVSTNTSSHGYAVYLSRFFAANLPSHRLFLDLHGLDESTITSEQLLFGQWQVLPHGFVWRIVQAASSSTQLVDQWQAYTTQQERSQSLLVTCCGLASHTAPLSLRKGSWDFVVVSIAHDAMYQRSLAKLSYWLTHGTVTTMAQIEQTVVALDAIQYELYDVVWAGIQYTDGAITYDLYAVEKNAVVGRQRFQLHLEVLAELVAHGRKGQPPSEAIQLLLSQRERRREETITQVEAFLVTMESQRDEDVDALRHGLATLASKRTSLMKPLGKSPQQRKKRRKKKVTV